MLIVYAYTLAGEYIGQRKAEARGRWQPRLRKHKMHVLRHIGQIKCCYGVLAAGQMPEKHGFYLARSRTRQQVRRPHLRVLIDGKQFPVHQQGCRLRRHIADIAADHERHAK